MQRSTLATALDNRAGHMMDEGEFARWAKLLEQRTGIELSLNRRSFLESSLNIRMAELGYEDYQSYYDYLITGNVGAVEWEILVDRLTIHETRFYRDANAQQILRTEFLEKLSPKNKQTLNVWSVGCATGEEPYSFAIQFDDFRRTNNLSAYVSITATDISHASLSTGRKGLYPANRLTNLPDELKQRYFAKTDNGYYQVSPDIQKRVCFTRLNLLELNKAKVGQMDLIFCQNVLIYFKRERRLEILNSLVNHLKPGGILVLGAGEILDWRHPDLTSLSREGTLAYRRTGKTSGSATDTVSNPEAGETK